MSVRVLIVPGSNRAESLNRKLANAAASELAGRGAIVTLISLSDFEMPIYDGDLETEQGRPAAADRLIELFLDHDAVLIVSPEYNAGIPPLLKNVIDWMSRGEEHPFKERVFALAAASPGRFGGLRGLMMLRQTLGLGLGALIIPEQFLLPGARQAFNEDGSLTDDANPKMLQAMVKSLLYAARKMKPIKN
jgi:NAD(P)H-dependent FMN reductase